MTATVPLQSQVKAEFRGGSFISDDPKTRGEAIETVKTESNCFCTRSSGTNRVNVRPGRDGFDYAFQVDYNDGGLEETWKPLSKLELIGLNNGRYRLQDERATELVVSKQARRRRSCSAEEVGLPGVFGALFDSGHTIWGCENMAEVIALLNHSNRLVHVHFK